jgi:hypothetical protein
MVTIPVYRSKAMHRATTYAELRFERVIVSYRWHWWDGNLYKRQEPRAGLQLTILPPFRQQSPREFVTYSITLGMPLRVKFDSENKERVEAISIATPKGYVKATRLP